ncbi:MAG: NHL repeat-containing protein [Gemmatimonadota bacterium]
MTLSRKWVRFVGAAAVLAAGSIAIIAAGDGKPALSTQHESMRRTQSTALVYTANLKANTVSVHDLATGQPAEYQVEPNAGGLSAPTGVAIGPDGLLYVSSSGTDQILRYDPDTGGFLDVFTDDERLAGPFSLAFAADGSLFVSSGRANVVLRVDGESGQVLGVAATDTLMKVPIGLAVQGDSLLHVASAGSNAILTFALKTGVLLHGTASDDLKFPSDVALGPDGALYVSSAFDGKLVRMDASTRATSEIARLPGEGGVMVGIAFDGEGRLLAGDFGRSRLYILDSLDNPEFRLLTEVGLAGPENIVVRSLKRPSAAGSP